MDCYVVFKDLENNEYIKINTIMVERKDFDNAFKAEYIYKNGGFFVKVLNRKLNKKDTYQICILHKNNNDNKLIETYRFLSLGEEEK